jgi:hypothetical protein
MVAMKRVVLVALAELLVPAAASAHPIEPLVTESAVPAPRNQLALGSQYSVLRGEDATEQELELEAAAGIGTRGELSFGTSIDAAEGTVGAVDVGAKLLLALEGPTGIDLSLAGSVATDGSGEASMFMGRSLLPGLYLQGRGGVEGAPGEGTAFDTAAALQWAPIPRFLPTLEATYGYGFGDKSNAAWIVPEAVYLIDINHLALKAAVPIGLAGDVEIGAIFGIDWQG